MGLKLYNLRIQVAHLSERADYEGQLTELRGDYAKTKEELEGEIMVLTKKLDSLEEFRQQKEQLSNKFDKLEGDSKDKMEEYEKKIYNLEKNHIREQAVIILNIITIILHTIISPNPGSGPVEEGDDGES